MAGTLEQPERIEAIDALRGFALIGIFLINILVMGGPIATEAPPGPATLSNPNWQVWLVSQLFVLGSMRGLFSMLFGASMLLFLRTNNQAAFLRRSFWLACFGLVNGTLLLWPGDILLIYGLAAPLLLLFLRASNTRLYVAAALIMAALSVWSLMRAMGGGGAEDAAAAAAALAAERGARLGDYADTFQFMWQVSLEWTFTTDLLWWIGDATAFMLIGMGLMRSDILTGKARTPVYVWLAVLGFALGLAVRGWAAASALANDGDVPLVAQILSQVGRLAVSLGWVGVFMLAWRFAPWRALFAPFSALGKMAFTGYLLQSIIAAFVFSGFGLGLWNALSWPQLWLLVFAIMAALSVAFMLWQRVFRIGPFEWVWRYLTFGRPPVLRRQEGATL